MKFSRFFIATIFIAIAVSCGRGDKSSQKQELPKVPGLTGTVLPLDNGFSRYISAYTSGIIPAASAIEIRFTQEFASAAGKRLPSGLFEFSPAVKGKTEWADETTLVFRPSKPLDPGKTYTGRLNIHKLGNVEERLKEFPIRIQTLKKDFTISCGIPESSPEGDRYTITGELTTADFIPDAEAESFVDARLNRRKTVIKWEHEDNLVHRFTLTDIVREERAGELTISWDGTVSGIRRKGSQNISIPASGDFIVMDVRTRSGDNPAIDIVFSDPVDESQETEGLVFLEPAMRFTTSISRNVLSLLPADRLPQTVTLNIEPSLRNIKGKTLSSSFSSKLEFAPLRPEIRLIGKGLIVPSSQNLIFPFRAANLKAVDLKIIKIFENNLPYFLQESEMDRGYYIKRFGRPVYSGRVDLNPESGSGGLASTGTGNPAAGNSPGTGTENSGAITAAGTGSWNLYTIDLADYINVEPGVLYNVRLSMRRSYSTLSCSGDGRPSRFEELLDEAREMERSYYDDPDDYFDDSHESIYYSMGFRWEDRDNPCLDAYYSPDRNVSRNILASNLGLIAKMGEDNILHVSVNDLLTAMPVTDVRITAYDYQMQQIVSGSTDPEGSFSLYCPGKPFLVTAEKDRDRNYLKVNDGSSLPLSSFDVSGTRPEKGIKAFIHGERDVWRPGDSIYLSLFIRDMLNDLPADHPVQFELINPLEQRVDNQIHKPEGKRLIVVRTATGADAITGNYSAQFRIGGAVFTKRIRIETIKPNRLKINLDFPSEILGGSERSTTGNLGVKWLNGAVAGNLNASVDYLLKHTKTEFPKYSQYVFDDPVAEYYTETVNIFNNRIDDNGNALIAFSPGEQFSAPGMLNALFTVRVMEPGGDESIIQSDYKYAPFPVFVGISLPELGDKGRTLYTDRDNQVRIVTLNEKGIPVSSEVELNIYKLSYRWWWESDDEYLADYISGRIHKPVIRQKVIVPAGGTGIRFNIGRKEWGRYLVRASTPSGHSTGKIVLVDWPWEYGMKPGADGATLLAVNTDKEKYHPGDEVRLSFPSPENARAIISIENATGVLNQINTRTDRGSTEVRFRVTSGMAPNVYAHVSVIQPHGQTVNDMPVRLYGIAGIMVEDKDSRLQPVINAPAEVRSRQSFAVSINEASGRAMSYTLAVVDEGLLDITGFRTPDPWNYFYAREALGVRTWDLYDQVFGSFGGTLDRIFAVGGDESLIDRSASKAQRFIPVVKFLGPFHLRQGKTNTHMITLPQYTGSVRAMVTAGNETAYGASDRSILVRDPLMVLATAPRVIGPGEKAALPVTVFINSSNIREVSLKAEGNGFISFPKASETLSAAGSTELNSEFAFIAGGKTGIAGIKVTATGGGETAVHEIQIPVRNPNPPETRSELKLLKPGEKWETSFTPFGTEGSSSAVIGLSGLPSANLEKHLDYLLNYPHGCTEQIVSAAFPQIWLGDLFKNDEATAAQSATNIKEAIGKILSRQMVNGGFGAWPGSYQADNWITSYTGHFMTEAGRKGYNITSGFLQKWTAYQKKAAREWRY
ncbi:MAG TPA: alpha-2-macroglobulin family protein, partial [Bacteroidales bacterium]|nr:alpha-2-macroglobulin family protein [Bacteroidales bacterium]